MNESPPSLASLRLMVTCLTIGLCVFGGTILFSASRIGGRMIVDPLPSYILAGVAALVLLFQWAIVPKWSLSKKAAAANDHELVRVYGSEILIRVALIEGAAALQFIFYLFGQNEVTLVAGIVLVLSILFLRPSAESFRYWSGNN